ncbi:2-polyprenyl-6-methoxyphenol hydroxylase-like FAD-dependent oxidoreductase [Saccharopolyspora erythraea NRRL 2338]|uniref:FAD-binding monooxygenase, PheA/TfdB family n=2 Tax=Saccharopolyspora erythraea TaxID=1836 RepID=A4FH81_SACEN|nr:FAD-dependent monooxygenase [Saccharopolyspora erythraea]AAQ94250.1 monooxygenase [Saccharopolyspora erythraea]EQD82179.1 PheA/TfdB family FAD-binding monooxygenase [Saccharopolyspora erythraea D]PFG97106.1 2-polyprenyl-6-methoxyphenol hydroxylase-like FAD-dependent oxidoreductase [Saccharopolyspora erythraea NRRL 2338]QRK87314.1 FAD-dependent monooxygenase [Saccharopolyspora erythraea]CAM03406.1 FAD-binding monooxygenase, PheA/TfdB family [Saccharopolyspora erythraea NRRL 2338]
MKQHDTVLVVGAGPCGLAVAAELRRLGVQVTIVDSEPVAGTGSRAILLWPPVLEVLDELGVGATARETGLQPQALSYHLGTGRTVRVGLGAENAPLLLPQERTSALLEQALVRYGGAVERGIRITKVVQHDDSVAASALHPDGTTTDFEADWLIAADGLRSQVREQLGVPFEGEQLPTTFLLAEGRLEGDIGRDSIHYFLGETGVVLVAPLPGGEFRISGAIPEGTQVSTAQVQRLLDERGPGGLRVGELRALSTFVSHERAAGTLHTGRAFLLGDAAHVHSAIGGQGLNLGIQDARNLAWKLAGVVHGRFAPVVLRSYEAERRVAIRQTLATTGRMARQAVAGPLARRVRDVVWGGLEAVGAMDRWWAPLLAGWRSRYPDVLLGEERHAHWSSAWRLSPRPGTRNPHLLPKPDDGLAGRFQLVTWGGPDCELARRGRELAGDLPGVVAHFALGGRRERFVLLRPDSYVAAAGGPADFTAARSLLDDLTTV